MQKAAFTIREAAQQGAMSERTVYRLLKEGKLKARKRGSRTLILSEDFRAWLDSLPLAEMEGAN